MDIDSLIAEIRDLKRTIIAIAVVQASLDASRPSLARDPEAASARDGAIDFLQLLRKTEDDLASQEPRI